MLSDEIIDKIKFLCQKINKVEWSGILFYTVEGSIRDVSTVKLIVKDILLMDKGTKAYTEYEWDEDVVAYQMDNPEAIDWIKGHIHSHNDMNVFFSGEDKDELNENVGNHNIYLSLIVNNFLDFEAKLVFTAQPQMYQCKDENGEDYTLELSGNLIPKMFMYDCKVEHTVPEIAIPDEFAKRLDFVENKIAEKKRLKEEEDKKKAANKPPSNYGNTYGQNFHNGYGQGGYHPGKKELAPVKELPDSGKYGAGRFQQGQLGLSGNWEDDETKTPKHIATPEESFACYILRLGTEIVDDTLEEAVIDIDQSKIDFNTMADYVIDHYNEDFEYFFEDIPGYEGDRKFIDVIEKVVDLFEQESHEYDFLIPLIKALTEYGQECEQEMSSKEVVENLNKETELIT